MEFEEIIYDTPEFEIGDSVVLLDGPEKIGEVVGSDFDGEEVFVSWGDETTRERARDLDSISQDNSNI